MLLNPSYLLELLNTNNIKINKCIHIGAHKCEELPIYITMGFAKDDIIWIEGNDDMVAVAKNNNISVHNYIITDKDYSEVILYKANDTASSSILDMSRHTEVYPDISYVNSTKSKSITIQGAELMALRGATNYLKYAKAIYIKIHEIELYKNCPSVKDIDDFLRDYNFTRVITIMTDKGWGDALYTISS